MNQTMEMAKPLGNQLRKGRMMFAMSGPRWGLAASTALVLTLSSACSGSGGGGAASSGGSHDTVVIAYNNTVNTLDPISADFDQENFVDQALYNTLVTYDAHGKIVPALATQATLEKGARAIDVTLRSGVKFHDGAALTANDIAFTLDRVKSLGTGVAQFASGYQSTQVISPTKLVIHFSKPNSLFLGGLSKIYILNSKLVRQHMASDSGRAWLSSHDAGSGPYQLNGSASPQSGTIRVARYRNYWSYDAGRPKQLVYRLFSTSAAERDALRSGEVDLATDLSAQDAQTLKGTAGITEMTPYLPAQYYIYFNVTTGATANPVLRRAIQLGYDYQGALSKIMRGAGKLAEGPMPLTLPCRPKLPTSKQNIAQAKAMVKSAGLNKATLTLNYQTYDPAQVAMATLFQTNMKAIGLKVKLVTITFPDYLTKLSKPATIPQMMLVEDFAQFPDPGAMLVNYYMGDKIGSNRTGYNNPRVNSTLSKALASSSDSSRCALYQQAQTQVDKDAVAVNMYTVATPYGFPTWLHGVNAPVIGFRPSIADLRVG
jgi:peptide/nickel transport system substrate-binding protein